MRKQKVTIALCILLALMCSFVSISVAVAGAMPATAVDANYGTEESGYAETPLFTAYVQHSNRNGTKGDGIGKIKLPTYADHADVPEKAQDEGPIRWLVNDPNGGQEKTVTYTHERNHKHWLGGESSDNEHIKYDDKKKQTDGEKLRPFHIGITRAANN